MTALPKNPEQARAELPLWKARKSVAYLQFQAARVAWEQASTNYDVVSLVAAGEFGDDPPVTEEVGFYSVRPIREHACGSRGVWSWQV